MADNLEELRKAYRGRMGLANPPMITDVDTALKEIADFYVKNRREITEPELEAILLKHCEEVRKFVKFLETEPGQLRFKTLLRKAQRVSTATPAGVKGEYRPVIGKQVRARPPIIHEAVTENPDPTEFMPIEVTSAFPEGAESVLTAWEKAKIDEFIEEVPDKNDPGVINYWVDMGDKKVYLEGWCDKCLAGTGYPSIGRGEWDEKIRYMVRDSKRTLPRKATERGFTLIEGGFREFEAGDRGWLYGVTWGVYKLGQQQPTQLDNGYQIPKTRVASLGFQELELPVARAVEALVNENPWSSGFHGALNQRWTIVFRGKVSDEVVKAAEAAGLEVSYREAPIGSGQILTDVSLPDVGVTEIEKATETFNRFAELYEKGKRRGLEGKYYYREKPQGEIAKSYAEGLGYRASLEYRNGMWELTIGGG